MKAIAVTTFVAILGVISLTSAVPIENEVFSLDNTGLHLEGQVRSASYAYKFILTFFNKINLMISYHKFPILHSS